MTVGIQITIIGLLLLVFYQDIKERKVTLVLLLLLLGLTGFLHSRFHLFEVFLLNILINIAIISIVVLILLLYSRFLLKKKLFEAIGPGDILFFLVLAVSFPIPSFLIIFSCSLLFALALSIVWKLKAKNKTIPLAGLQALFVSLMMICNLGFNFIDLYRI